MVKGITRQVILVKSPDPRLFEEAIFIVKEEALAREGVTAEQVLKEARRAADGEHRQLCAGQHPAVAALGEQVLVDGVELLGVAVPPGLHVVINKGHDQLLGLRGGGHRRDAQGGELLLV